MKYIIKKNCNFIFFIILFFQLNSLFSQEELVSAKDLLAKFSENFKNNIKDYEAEIKWIQNDSVQKGVLYFKNPQKLKIIFSDPGKQVICTNGYELWVYIDFLNVILHQNILQKEKKKTAEGKTELIVNPILLNPMGYDRFLKDYSIEFLDKKTLVDYKDNIKVYKFKLLRWRSSKNGFNVIILFVDNNGLIRKVEGTTAAYRKIILELDNIKINNNLSDLIFNYEPPAHANLVDNFITNQGEN